MNMPRMSSESLTEIARLMKSMGEPSRLKILQSLHEGEKTVGSIVDETGLSQTNTSKQIKLLTQAKLISGRRNGNQIFYRIAHPSVKKICDSVCRSYVSIMKSHIKQLKETL